MLTFINTVSTYFFQQLSPSLCHTATDHVVRYVRSTIALENASAVATLCRAAARADPPYALKRLVPYLCESIVELAESHPLAATGHETIDKIDDKLSWCLQLLIGTIAESGAYLLPFKDILMEVLDAVLPLAPKAGVDLASQLLQKIFKALLMPYPLEERSVPPSIWALVRRERERGDMCTDRHSSWQGQQRQLSN